MTITEEGAAPRSVAASRPIIRHQPALDGLRGVAVAGVLLFHGGHLAGGYLGVDAFFVLSGFLITTLLLVEHGGKGRIALGHFWARRARRLLPALGCVLAAVAVYAAFVAQPGELPTIRGDAFSTLFYVANWHAIFSAGDYFAIFRSPSPLEHTWSLAIEEQFYLVWPLVLAAVLTRGMPAKAAAKRVLVLSVVLAGCSAALSQLLYTSADPSRVYYGTDTRAAAILIGASLAAALAAWGPVKGTQVRRALEAAAIVAVGMLALAWTRLYGDSNFLYRGGLLLCGIAAAVVIAAAIHPSRGPISATLSFKPLCALGIISYGVYLWHWPIFVWLNEDRTSLSGWPLFGLQCAATFAVALVSYRVVERPIRHGWGTPRVMARAVPLTAAALVAALLAATPATSLPVVAAWLPGVHEVPKPTDARWKEAMAFLRRESGVPGHLPRVLVYGDSIALTLGVEYPGGVYRGVNMEGAAIGLIGCSLLQANRIVGGKALQPDPDCAAWPTLFREAVNAFHPQIVALMLGPWEMFDRQTRSGRQNAGSRLLTLGLEAKLSLVRNIVARSGGRLVILNSPCYQPTKNRLNDRYHEEDIWRDTARLAWLNRVWRDFSARHSNDTSVANLSDLLCPGGTPIEAKVDHRYRDDGMHFTRSGATLVWQWLDKELARTPAG